MRYKPLPQPANGPISSKANPGVLTLNDGASRDLLRHRGDGDNRLDACEFRVRDNALAPIIRRQATRSKAR